MQFSLVDFLLDEGAAGKRAKREGGLLAQVCPADCDRLLGAWLEAVIAPLFIQHKDS